MDDRDRKRIQDNLEKLIEVTEWNAVLENCVVRHATLKKMINTIRVNYLASTGGQYTTLGKRGLSKKCVLGLFRVSVAS